MDKELLFAPRHNTPSGMREDDVEVPGVGTVRVRGLSRIEALHVQAANGEAATERRIMALGMLDPVMTESEVGRWQKASEAGEIEVVSKKIAELSGMLPGADKESYKSVSDGSDE